MTEKDYQLYGTKILNLKTQEIGLLICIWKNRFADGEIDYASHIKPWSKSDDSEKLDFENILLLCSMHDALFDKGLISFDDNGKILISRELGEEEKALVNINEDSCIDINSQKQKDYLKYHRKNIFIK